MRPLLRMPWQLCLERDTSNASYKIRAQVPMQMPVAQEEIQVDTPSPKGAGLLASPVVGIVEAVDKAVQVPAM